jgi:hypothetical protein
MIGVVIGALLALLFAIGLVVWKNLPAEARRPLNWRFWLQTAVLIPAVVLVLLLAESRGGVVRGLLVLSVLIFVLRRAGSHLNSE